MATMDVMTSISVRNSFLASNISVTSQNRLSGKYSLIFVGKSDLASSIQLRLVKDISASISVGQHNRLSLTVDVQPPPRVKVNLAPSKDAVVREGVSTFNYGTQQDMYVGYSASGNERFRSFIGFDMTQVPAGRTIDTIVLKIYHDQYYSAHQQMNVYQVNQDWTEQGITWADQPLSLTSTMNNVDIDSNAGYTSIDITELAKGWYDESIFNGGICLKASDEKLQSNVRMYTKESSYPPILEVTYIDDNIPSTGNVSLTSSITPRFNLTKDVSASVDVRAHWNQSSINATTTVNLPWQLRSSVSVSRKQINGSLTVTQKGTTQLSVETSVRVRSFVNLPTSIKVSQPYFKSSITARKSANVQLQTTVSTRQKAKYDISGSISANRVQISGSITVKQISQLQTSITVPNKNNVQIQGSVHVYPHLMVSINVKQRSDLSSNIDVVAHKNTSIPVSMSVRKSSRTDLSGSMTSIQWNQVSASVNISSGWMKSSIKIPFKSNKDLSVSAVARVNWFNDLSATINTGELRKIYVFFM